MPGGSHRANGARRADAKHSRPRAGTGGGVQFEFGGCAQGRVVIENKHSNDVETTDIYMSIHPERVMLVSQFECLFSMILHVLSC